MKFEVAICITVRFDDGTVRLRRHMQLPFVPAIGMSIFDIDSKAVRGGLGEEVESLGGEVESVIWEIGPDEFTVFLSADSMSCPKPSDNAAYQPWTVMWSINNE